MKLKTVRPIGLVQIKEYERGVLLRFGASKGILQPGLHTAFPFADEIRIVDMRPVSYETSFNILSKDNYQFNTTIDIRYKVNDPEAAVIKSPENLEEQINFLLKSEASKEIYNNRTMDVLLSTREEVAEDICSFLNKHTSQWGLGVETVQVKVLTPPSQVPELQLELYELIKRERIEPLRAEIDANVKVIGAEAEARAYKAKAIAKLEVIEKGLDIYTNAVGKLANELVNKYGPTEARDIMFIAMGNSLGDQHPVAQKIRTKMQAEGITEAAKSAAQELQTSPEFIYAMTAFQNMNMNCLGIFDMKSITSMADLDKQIRKKTYGRE